MALTEITDTVVLRMLTDSRALGLFGSCLLVPALTEPKPAKTSCPKCNKRATGAKLSATGLNTVLACLAGLSKPDKRALVVYLGADKVRIRYSRSRNGKSETVVVTF